MSNKKTKTVPKRLREYLAEKARLECDYTEYGVLSYVVPSGGRHRKPIPKSKRANGKKRKGTAVDRK
jgi:hypothetical protein